jgi:hypothetical protein
VFRPISYFYFQGILFLAFLFRIASKVSSAMSIVIEQLPEQKDVAPVERQDDDVSWMELNFVENDDNKSLLSFAKHCAISVTLGGDDDDDDDDEASISSKEQKPSSYSKPTPTSRRRPKKTTLHKKSKSFDDTIIWGSDKKKKKKKKDKKKSKAGEDSGEFSSKSKRKEKKRASASATSISDDDSLAESLESLVSSAHSGSSKRKGMRRPLSLSPKQNSGNGRSGLVQKVQKMTTRGAGLVKQISFRSKGLKDQLAQSEHGPDDRRGLMGQILYNGFDDDSDSEDEFDALF